MTTSVKVHVNGAYRATIIMKDIDGKPQSPVIVEGNYIGSTNPSGEHTFYMYHPAAVTFDLRETQLTAEEQAKAKSQFEQTEATKT